MLNVLAGPDVDIIERFFFYKSKKMSLLNTKAFMGIMGCPYMTSRS